MGSDQSRIARRPGRAAGAAALTARVTAESKIEVANIVVDEDKVVGMK